MKKVLTIGLAGLLALSCTVRQERVVEWYFDAACSTKASISGEGVFSWQKEDRIDVWNETEDAFVPFTTIAGLGRFMGMAPENAVFSGAAFYPAGIAGTPSQVTLPALYGSPEEAAASFPMFAAVDKDDKVLHFKHLGALLTIMVERAQPQLTRLTLRSPGTGLSGTFDLSAKKEVAGKPGNGTVGVSFSLSQEGTLSITLPLPTGTYPLSVCLGNQENPDMLVLSTASSLTFERAGHYRLRSFDYLTERYAIEENAGMETLTLEDESSLWE